MINESKIKELIESHFAGTEQFLVDVKVKSGNNIIVEIDSENDFSINYCVEINRLIEENFDREVEDYELEVSSPGADSPFKVFKQYKKNCGKRVQVILEENKILTGILVNANEEEIEFQELIPSKVKGKKPKLSENNSKIKYNQIKQINVIISFK